MNRPMAMQIRIARSSLSMCVAGQRDSLRELNCHESGAPYRAHLLPSNKRQNAISTVTRCRLHCSSEKNCEPGTNSAALRSLWSTALQLWFPRGGWPVWMPSARSISQFRTEPRGAMPVKKSRKTSAPDAMRLEIFKNIFHSISEEMGAALRRSAFSSNIKERRDYSCAVYDGNGEVLAMGDHMPVHLGSMPASVAAARAALMFEPGDIALLNDPFAGGTHLPDLTLVMPVFVSEKRTPQFFVASRAHHADIGGALAGSMGPAREIL